MPQTAKRFGATDPMDPLQSIKAGTKYLKYLDSYWSKKIEDKDERTKFVLASYNAGLGHVLDAYRLAAKNKVDSLSWNNGVANMLLMKSDFMDDPVVKSGYCKCEEPVNYVSEVLGRYEQYRSHIQSEEVIAAIDP
jgi:membrane-bound lytic murein transglycosylase F